MMPDILGQSNDTARARLTDPVPASYPKQFLDIAAERGIARERMLAGTSLSLAQLEAPSRRIPASAATAVMRNALALTGDPGIGLEWGLRANPAAYAGYAGFAAGGPGTLRSALAIGKPARAGALIATLSDEELVIEAREHDGLGALRRTFVECALVGFYTTAGVLLGEPQPAGEIRFDWPEPDYFARFRTRLPGARFAAPRAQVRLSARYLDRSLTIPDFLLERVRAQLAPGPGGYADLERVAAKLVMSARTLKRKLHDRGTTFRALLDDARFHAARQLLDDPELAIQEVASALGYRDPACFTRAFRRWSGRTPSQARAERKASSC
jgi:AraC-like DNA-binding protein